MSTTLRPPEPPPDESPPGGAQPGGGRFDGADTLGGVCVPITSGIRWEEDPEENTRAAAGRCRHTWLRAADGSGARVMFKRPPANLPSEVYAMGMERVAYRLGTELGLAIPAVYIESFNGEFGSMHVRLPDQHRTYLQAGGSPMMLQNILNRETWPLAVAFDLVLANMDRKDDSILVVPDPSGTLPQRAIACESWLVDFGFGGLWPPNKFDAALVGKPAGALQAVGDGAMLAAYEERLRSIMPADYRKSLEGLDQAGRSEALDRVRQLSDDRIHRAVDEIPDSVMTAHERGLTEALLKTRRDSVDKLLEDHWLVA